MSNIFKPGDKVAILYPYPADKPEQHFHFKHGQPLIVTSLGRYAKNVIYCRALDDGENTGIAVKADRLDFYSVVEKEPLSIPVDAEVNYIDLQPDMEPFDLIKSKSGSYDTYFRHDKVEEASPTIDGLFVVKVEKNVYYVADKSELWLKPITRTFYYPVYNEAFGNARGSLEAADIASLPGCMGIVEVSYSNGKLISVNIVK
jgi:hypothetical protein